MWGQSGGQRRGRTKQRQVTGTCRRTSGVRGGTRRRPRPSHLEVRSPARSVHTVITVTVSCARRGCNSDRTHWTQINARRRARDRHRGFCPRRGHAHGAGRQTGAQKPSLGGGQNVPPLLPHVQRPRGQRPAHGTGCVRRRVTESPGSGLHTSFSRSLIIFCVTCV